MDENLEQESALSALQQIMDICGSCMGLVGEKKQEPAAEVTVEVEAEAPEEPVAEEMAEESVESEPAPLSIVSYGDRMASKSPKSAPPAEEPMKRGRGRPKKVY